ncbi:pyrroloquinoline quinone biosynthesis peptide chaperone PqqD [Litorivicinus sp.]|nr:pyrroloquinoline quinone biosynthesis peptide chaperone PqqD [Litorivicinus sp.]MDC1209079.1 pyrroloquinoline quinone biosynthesis peptide chaperone PqqD [Litorivicinus sp.]MDC1239862.1 pyrroloquinoline quinone biosynthesis peptide chaperone PqqD [Litorivicinus sp.]MDC1319490.1 pyrroloquinoline quinone biosynthesis peptide chaperone PqqD [Litorivicinus sp.]MDC1466760.1 pyrroloquinoline quinone biosynthesis peptide chaperone PqqD [Litorivicinus sp.]
MSSQLIPSATILQFESGVRLKHDAVRNRYVVLGPEMLVELNETGTAIMSKVDGEADLQTVIQSLAEQFQVEPRDIEMDVTEFCTSMVMRRVLMP